MSESQFPPAGAAPSGVQPMPPLMVNVQYIKDLSFEVPNAPEIYATLRSQPAVQINLDVQARTLQEGGNVYEVVLSVKAEAREAVQNGSGEGRAVFVAELHYAGVFTLNNVPPEAVEPLLLIECPRLAVSVRAHGAERCDARGWISAGVAAADRFCWALAGAQGARSGAGGERLRKVGGTEPVPPNPPSIMGARLGNNGGLLWLSGPPKLNSPGFFLRLRPSDAGPPAWPASRPSGC